MDIDSNSADYIFDMLSKKYKLSKGTLKMIVRSEFECVKDVMRKVDSYNDYWPSIRLIYLCSFIIKKARINYFRKKSIRIFNHVYSKSEQQSRDRATDVVDPGVQSTMGERHDKEQSKGE